MHATSCGCQHPEGTQSTPVLCTGGGMKAAGTALPLCPSPQEYPLSALAGTACLCGFPTTLFTLHEREDEQLCAQRCPGEEFESCGTSEFLLVYQTQVQGEGLGSFGGLGAAPASWAPLHGGTRLLPPTGSLRSFLPSIKNRHLF